MIEAAKNLHNIKKWPTSCWVFVMAPRDFLPGRGAMPYFTHVGAILHHITFKFSAKTERKSKWGNWTAVDLIVALVWSHASPETVETLDSFRVHTEVNALHHTLGQMFPIRTDGSTRIFSPSAHVLCHIQRKEFDSSSAPRHKIPRPHDSIIVEYCV